MINLRVIGKSLKKLRLSRGLTLAQLSNLTSVSPVTVHNIEKGLYEPKISTLVDICSALKVPIDQFIRPKINDIFLRIPSESEISVTSSKKKKKRSLTQLPTANRLVLLSNSETILSEPSGWSISLYLVFGRVDIECGSNKAQLLPDDTLHLETYQDIIISAKVESLIIKFGDY